MHIVKVIFVYQYSLYQKGIHSCLNDSLAFFVCIFLSIFIVRVVKSPIEGRMFTYLFTDFQKLHELYNRGDI